MSDRECSTHMSFTRKNARTGTGVNLNAAEDLVDCTKEDMTSFGKDDKIRDQ